MQTKKNAAAIRQATMAQSDKNTVAISNPTLQEIAKEAMESYCLLLEQHSGSAAVYAFTAHDVLEIHLRKHGCGRGVWFRLRDGRVFDIRGCLSENGREWYESRLH